MAQTQPNFDRLQMSVQTINQILISMQTSQQEMHQNFQEFQREIRQQNNELCNEINALRVEMRKNFHNVNIRVNAM